MAEVPVAHKELEELIFQVALELIEQWAIDDRIPADDDETINTYRQYAVDDTVLVINSYMDKFNELMSSKAISQIQG